MSCWGKRNWDPKGKHCYVTGGSTGLGLALAILLAKHGAHVSIVARNEKNLEAALDKIKAARQSDDQIFQSRSFSLTTPEESQAALKAVTEAYDGKVPDSTFLCAGSAVPRYFIEKTSDELQNGMTNGYWIQAWTAWAVSQEMVRQRRKGKLVFVSSTLGYITLPGYSSYAPAKHALRGLADTLRSELLLYDISVHIFMAGTMFTPGYEEENKTKPKLTLQLEGSDGMTPDVAAAALFKGVKNNNTHINGDFVTELLRVQTKGASPGHFFLWDWCLGIIACIAVPIWRASVDREIRKHRQEHQARLAEIGFLKAD